jgi:hypothetical protein
MEFTPTNRDFYRGEFTERNGHVCSLQESSAMDEEGLIWLGINEADPEYCPMNGTGWHKMPLPDCVKPGMDTLFHTRMHLSQTHVQELMPSLMHFVKYGNLPDESNDETKQEMDGYRESIRLLREGV